MMILLEPEPVWVRLGPGFDGLGPGLAVVPYGPLGEGGAEDGIEGGEAIGGADGGTALGGRSMDRGGCGVVHGVPSVREPRELVTLGSCVFPVRILGGTVGCQRSCQVDLEAAYGCVFSQVNRVGRQGVEP
jgi:hypothetical protein